jgi:hypothetical protein
MRIDVTCNCESCDATYNDSPVTVDPHPSFGVLGITRWPDIVQVPGVGMTSLICSTLPVEQSTWGKVKALYTE